MAKFKTTPKHPLERNELTHVLGMLVIDENLQEQFKKSPEDFFKASQISLTKWEVNFLQTMLTTGSLPSIDLGLFKQHDENIEISSRKS